MGLFVLRIGLLILLGAAAVWLYRRWVNDAAQKQKLEDQNDNDQKTDSEQNQRKDDSDFKD